MLRDITTTSTNNPSLLPCISHQQSKEPLNRRAKEVKLDADGASPLGVFVDEAMAKEKCQRKKETVQGVNTPRRVKQQEVVAIGSSSTWNQNELDLLDMVKTDVDVTKMVPHKFFDFGGLENYDIGYPWSILSSLTAARNKLTSIQRADLSRKDVLQRKAGWFN